MIKSKTYQITLSYKEIFCLEDFLEDSDDTLACFARSASYSASADGITINCTTQRQADKIFSAVLEATEESEAVR